MSNDTTPKLGSVCVEICQYLNKYDAHINTLAEHCECSVPTIRRAIRTLQKAEVPIKHIRHVREDKSVEHYWRLERVFQPGETAAHLAYLYFPQEEADAILAIFQEQAS